MDGTLQAIKDGAHNVHADAAAGDFGDFGGGAETGLENQVNRVLVAEARSVIGFDKTIPDGLLADTFDVDAPAVVANFDDHLRTLVVRVEKNAAAGGFTRAEALVGRLNAVVHGIAHEVSERLGEGVENALVEVGVLSGISKATSLPQNLAMSRTTRGKRRKSCSTGTMRIFRTHL